MGNIAGCSFACNGDTKGFSQDEALNEENLMQSQKIQIPQVRAYVPPEGEDSEDHPQHIILTADGCFVATNDINTKHTEKIQQSTPQQEADLGGGTGGEPTNDPHLIFEDLSTPVVTNIVERPKSPLIPLQIEEAKYDHIQSQSSEPQEINTSQRIDEDQKKVEALASNLRDTFGSAPALQKWSSSRILISEIRNLASASRQNSSMSVLEQGQSKQELDESNDVSPVKRCSDEQEPSVIQSNHVEELLADNESFKQNIDNDQIIIQEIVNDIISQVVPIVEQPDQLQMGPLLDEIHQKNERNNLGEDEEEVIMQKTGVEEPPSANSALKNAHGQQILSLAALEEQMREEVFYIDTSSKPVTYSIFQSAEFTGKSQTFQSGRPMMRRF